MSDLVTLLHGDCLEVMPTLDAESVDAVVTDPPYGLSFMGKHWDHGAPAVEFWQEMHRVAKPGAYLLAFGGTRTVHRIATNIEDAGWIIRDMLMWIYASGFPKGKANLKPAHEPIVLARKPGPLRPLAIDECRIAAYDGDTTARKRVPVDGAAPFGKGYEMGGDGSPLGRWPSNVLLSDPELFDQPNPYVVGSGATSGGGEFVGPTARPRNNGIGLGESGLRDGASGAPDQYGDSGGYARFFIVPKTGRAERERGLVTAPKQKREAKYGSVQDGRPHTPEGYEYHREVRANVHPTVKPIDLMRHLVRLVTPPGGTVLDPFLGSGTTALAASEEGFSCIGIEREAEYLDIARARLTATPIGMGL